MTKLVRFFYRCLYWLVPWWYGLTLTVTRKRRYPQVQHYAYTKDIAKALNWGTRWRPDPVKGLLDVVMHPRKFQHLLDQGDMLVGDCDDHALYWATALHQSGLADRVWLGTVWYQRPGQKGAGHVVCVFESEGRRYWTDYGTPVRMPVGPDWYWASDVALARGAILHAAGLIEVKINGKGEPHLAKRVKRWLV